MERTKTMLSQIKNGFNALNGSIVRFGNIGSMIKVNIAKITASRISFIFKCLANLCKTSFEIRMKVSKIPREIERK